LLYGQADDEQSLDLLIAACHDLRNAKLFRELLNIILMMGNYMNGTNFAGGAFGFKIASINRVRVMTISVGFR
jgi:cytokinesis protein